MVLSSTLFVSVLIGQAAIKSVSELEDKWRSDYPKAVSYWGSIMTNYEAVGHFSHHWRDGSTTVIDELTVAGLDERKLYIQNRMKRVSDKINDNRDTPGVSCRTPEYAFGLKKDVPSGRYLLMYHEKNEEDEEARFNYWYGRYVKNATQYYGRSLMGRMLDSTFSLKSIEKLERDGEELVRINYSCELKYVIESGSVDLDPNKNWGIRSVDTKTVVKKNNYTGFFKEEVAYREIEAGRFFPVHMESNERHVLNPEFYERTRIDFDRVKLGSASPDLFRLSAYGIPDLPLRPEKRPTIFTFRNPVLWLSLAATVACFTLLWRLRARRVETT